MANLIPETAQKLLHTTETLVSAAKQSEGIHIVPLRLRRAIKTYLREQEKPNMRRKVLCLSESFNKIKDANLQLIASTSRELVDNPSKVMDRSKRWKIKSAYGDIGFKYRDDQTIAYVASRMPAVYSACHRVLKEVRRRLPGFQPKRVLDFGSGTGSVLWAVREVWPRSSERINLVEPSKSMQRVGQSLLRGLKDLPHIQSYDSLQSLMENVDKSERKHDLVMASYVLGEVASLKDRITIARQLWDLTQDVLVLVEPGTPQGYKIIVQMRSHILWMEKRRCRKSKVVNETSKEMVVSNSKPGAYVVAPCPHDGRCPLENTGKYCHFVQRLQRTSSQRSYKRSKGEPLRGFEDEKFCFVALRRGQRPSEPWPLDGMKFETLKEQRAKRNPEDLEFEDEDHLAPDDDNEDVPYEDTISYDSDIMETDIMDDAKEEIEEEEPAAHADLGGGWGRIVYTPVRRGRQVKMDVCRSIKQDGSEGAFDRIIVTQTKNPALHKQARRSLWGDLWPFAKE